MGQLAYQCVARARNEHLLMASYRFDVLHFRTYGEVSYRAALVAFPEHEFRRNQLRTRASMFMCSRSLFRAEFLYIRRSMTHYAFDRRVRFGRTSQSRFGSRIPYPHVEVECMRNQARVTRYVPLLYSWSKVVVRHRFFAELSSCIYYLGSQPIGNLKFGDFSLVAAKWAARIAVHPLWEAYENYRIW